MNKVSVTYHAPKGDSKVVEIWGHVFYDGKAEEVEVDDDTLKTMKGNRFFDVKEETPKEMEHQAKEHKGR
jgi:hypothetical protein